RGFCFLHQCQLVHGTSPTPDCGGPLKPLPFQRECPEMQRLRQEQWERAEGSANRARNAKKEPMARCEKALTVPWWRMPSTAASSSLPLGKTRFLVTGTVVRAGA